MKTAEPEKLTFDPLRVLHLPEVIRRTGYSRMTIMRYLAKDQLDKTPGDRFPVPLKSTATGKLEWREKTIVQWLEAREQK